MDTSLKASLLKIGHPHANTMYRIQNLIVWNHYAPAVLNLRPHFFLHCHKFLNTRKIFFDKIKLLDGTFLQLNEESLLTVLLFGS